MVIPFPMQTDQLDLVMTVERDESGWFVASRRGKARHVSRATSYDDAWETVAASASFFGIDLPEWARLGNQKEPRA